MGDRDSRGWQLVSAERDDIIAFLHGLTVEQWEVPSLCAGWRVRDVAAHLLVDEPVRAGMLRRVLPLIATGRVSPDQLNAAWVTRSRSRTPGSIVETFRADSHRPVGVLGHVLGAAVALRALVIHHQDMRRPLGAARIIPPERLLVTLDALVGRRGSLSVGSRPRAQGLRLEAVDVDWSHGEGPVVAGPGEAIVMALAGRTVALRDLAGEGTTVLAGRLS